MKKQNYIKATGVLAGIILTAATQTQAQRGPIRGPEGRPNGAESRLVEYISSFQERYEILAAADTNLDQVLDADEQAVLAEFIATKGLEKFREERKRPSSGKRGSRSGRGPGSENLDEAPNQSRSEARAPRGARGPEGPRPDDREPPTPEAIAERLAELYAHYSVYDVDVSGSLDSAEIEALATMIRDGEDVPPFAFFRPDRGEDGAHDRPRHRRGPRANRADSNFDGASDERPREPGRRAPGRRRGQ